MADLTIRESIGLGTANQYIYSKAPVLDCPDKDLLYGVELEIEGANSRWNVPGFDVKEDGSLRNGGLEFVSQPMTFSNLMFGLDAFFRKSAVTDDNYSERCSTHIHTNVQDITWDQLGTIALLYQVMEKLLFSFIGHDRDKNIFCVPWSETTINYDLIPHIKESNRSLRQWQKYTALNLRTVHTIGTIEWRHMEGTHDINKIKNWCRLIGCLYRYAKGHSLEDTKKYIVNLNTTSEYQRTLESVFGEHADLLRVPNYRELLEDGVLTMKYSLIGEEMRRLHPPPPMPEPAAVQMPAPHEIAEAERVSRAAPGVFPLRVQRWAAEIMERVRLATETNWRRPAPEMIFDEFMAQGNWAQTIATGQAVVDAATNRVVNMGAQTTDAIFINADTTVRAR